ncbi:MAG: acetyl-CoA carboxylase biotin carboxyl carrier protein [Acidobacteriota bacterium]
MSDFTASAEAKDKEAGGKSKAASKKKSSSADPSLNMEEIRELAELFNEQGFTDFEFENENIRVRLSKLVSQPLVQAVQPTSAPVASNARTTPVVSETHPIETEEDLYKITSPIVGTFYRSPGPDKEPYINEGSNVSSETVVCIIEAMKLMNEIQAETSGEVVKIYVENGQPVEFGQPLFGIRK